MPHPRWEAAQSDAKYALTAASYTKAQSDGNYAAAGSSYTKAQSDTKYGQIIFHEGFSGATTNPATNTVFLQVIAVPGAGSVLYFVDRAFDDGNGFVNIYLNTVYTGGTLFNTVSFAAAGSFQLKIDIGTGTASGTVNATGHVTVLFVPD